MATANQYINTAAKYIGISGTDNIFNRWYWGHACYDPDVYPWCACFQSYIGVHDLNMPFKASASASGVALQGKHVSAREAKRGDWVLFNWDGRKDFSWSDHIGVVEWFDHASGYFGTIEGNTGSGQGRVARCTRTINSSYATSFYRPPYKEEWDMDDRDMQKLAQYIAKANAEIAYGNDTKASWTDDGRKGGDRYRNNYNLLRMISTGVNKICDKLDLILTTIKEK